MKTNFWFLLILMFALSAAAIAQTNSTVPETGTAENLSRGYLLGPGDVVEGRVMGEEEYNFTATVDENGNIEVPFFEQPVTAQCRSERELRGDVTKLLSKYLRSPQLGLRVVDRKSRPAVTVSGEVRSPQLVDLKRQARLLELISFSGGTTEEAGGMVQVFRPRTPLCMNTEEDANWKAEVSNTEGGVPSRMYSLASVSRGRDEANPVIYPGDVIVVQKAAPVYFTGEIHNPQGVYIKNGALSLTTAIAQLGGFNREAKTKEVQIYRLKPNSQDRETISVNYDSIKKGTQKDVMLEPYDIVQIDKTKKSVAQVVFETVTGAARQGALSLGTSGVSRILY